MDIIRDPSLVFYADLGKHDGAAFMEESAYGHLCTVTGATWRPNGRYFDGSSYITMPTDTIATVLHGATASTYLAWINIAASAANQEIIRLYGVSLAEATSRFRVTADEKLSIGGRSTAGETFESDIMDAAMSAGAWHFCMGALDYANDTTYLSLDDSALETKTVTFDSNTFVATGDATPVDSIGSDSGVAGFIANTGIVGEVWIYSRLLNPMEAQHNRLATKWKYR